MHSLINLHIPPGQLVSVNNSCQLHIFCKGNASPTVVMTSGFGSPSAYTDFYPLMNELYDSIRVCAYDRAGYGWSSNGVFPVTIDKTVENLHRLLINAGEQPPYLLSAHSVGSLEMLHFATKYPDEVAAIILIDGISPKSYKNLDTAKPLKILKNINRNRGLFKLAANIGLLKDIRERKKYLPAAIFKADKELLLNNFANDAMIEMTKAVKQDAETVRQQINIKNIPLLIITAKETLTDKRFNFTNWGDDQQYLLSLSNKSKQVFLKSSHTIIMLEKANEIAKEIKAFIKIL